MDFNIEEYINIFQRNGQSKAKSYKSKYIPKKLYKFFPLVSDKEKNNLKFKSLENNKTWLSGFDYLNDPFEFKMFSLNKARLQKYNWDEIGISLATKAVDLFRASHYICCFVEEMSLPMWAYYANNHLGFCVEYEVKKTVHLYKVLYEKERILESTVTSYFVKSLINDAKTQSLQSSEDTFFWSEMLKLSFTIKHNSWKHEQEYRLILPSLEDGKNGILVNNDEIKIKPSKIFVGMSCERENEDKLKSIARDLEIDIFKMYVDSGSLHFDLSIKDISYANS